MTYSPSGSFNQLSEGLTDAFKEISNLRNSSEVAAAIGFIQPAWKQVQRAASFTADYSRRHPVRMAISVAALGLVIAALARGSATKRAVAELH